MKILLQQGRQAVAAWRKRLSNTHFRRSISIAVSVRTNAVFLTGRVRVSKQPWSQDGLALVYNLGHNVTRALNQAGLYDYRRYGRTHMRCGRTGFRV